MERCVRGGVGCSLAAGVIVLVTWVGWGGARSSGSRGLAADVLVSPSTDAAEVGLAGPDERWSDRDPSASTVAPRHRGRLEACSLTVCIEAEGGTPIELDAPPRLGAHTAAGAGPGRYALQDLEPGRHELEVAPRAWPSGFSPGLNGQLQQVEERDGRAWTRPVELAPGPNEVRIKLERHGFVRGRVTDGFGAPVRDVRVRLMSAERARPHAGLEVPVDPNGAFLVSLPPARLRASVLLTERVAVDRFANAARPWVDTFTLGPGQTVDLDLRFGAGPCELAGRVVDDYAKGAPEPLGGLAVFLYVPIPPDLPEGDTAYNLGDLYGRVVTDAQGRFRMTGLPPVDVRVQVAPHAHDPHDRDCRMGQFCEPVEVRLNSDGGSTDAGDLIAYRARPTTLRGHLELDERPARSFRLRLETPRVRGDELVYTRREVELSPDGTYETWCHPSYAGHPHRWVIRGYDGERTREFFAPIGGELYEALPYP